MQLHFYTDWDCNWEMLKKKNCWYKLAKIQETYVIDYPYNGTVGISFGIQYMHAYYIMIYDSRKVTNYMNNETLYIDLYE